MQSLTLIDSWPVANAAAAVVRGDGVVASRGDTARSFRLASVTKALFAAAVLVACEEGALGLDDPAGPPGSTVRHLLAHASGLPLRRDGRVRPPGERRVYSNTGFEVLGEALSERSGIDPATYMSEAVCEPLGLTATELAGSPAHGAVSCVDDLAAFCHELLSPGRVFAPATVAEATRVQFPGLRGIVPGFGMQGANDWGLGLEIRDSKSPHWTGTTCSPETFGHFGQAGTFIWVDPRAGIALVCLTDERFGDWAKGAWPELSDAVLRESSERGGSGVVAELVERTPRSNERNTP